jgi:exonuclease VII small subunit
MIVVAAGAFWLGQRQGQRAAGYDAAAGARERRALESTVARLESGNAALNAKVSELEMARRLDREAYGQVERTLGDLQSKLARQSDDLTFYRSIVSPADGVQGLRIQRFAVRPGTQPREFVIEMTLIQAMRQDSSVSGLARVVLQGMEGSRVTRYTLGQLLGRPHAELPFSFRYFQTIEKAVVLPDAFQPFEVEVSVQSKSLHSPLRQSYPWTVADGADAGAVPPSDPPRGSSR